MSDPASFDETARHYVTRTAAEKRWGLRALEVSAMVTFVSAFWASQWLRAARTPPHCVD